MQTNLLEIKELLASWSSLIIENPLFVGVLALLVWLLAMVFYNIKILFLNKQQKASHAANAELQSQLDTAQQQVKQTEEQLAINAEQLEKSAQSAAELEANIAERNQKIVAELKVLAKQFDLSEQLVASDKEMKSEFIWQQQDNILMQLTERLTAVEQEKQALLASHQQEIAQITEKESLIGTLQTTLDMQAKQFAKLEASFDAQKTLQQQQQQAVQEQLTKTLAKHQIDFTQLIEGLQTQPQAAVVEDVQSNEPVAELQDKGDSVLTEEEAAPAVLAETEAEAVEIVAEAPSAGQNFMNMDSPAAEMMSPVDEPIAQDIETPETELDNPVSEPEDVAVDEPRETIQSFSVENSVLPETEEIEETKDSIAEPLYTQSNIKMPGKIKGLFGRGKNKKAARKVAAEQPVEPVVSVAVEEPKQETAADAEPAYGDSNIKIPGKIKGLFGRGKNKKVARKVAAEQPVEPVAEPKQEPIADAEPAYGDSNIKIPGKIKGLFGSSKKAVASVEAEPVVKEKVSGKFKNLLGKAKKAEATVKGESKQVIEEFKVEAAEFPEPEVSVEPDYQASNLKIPGKIQGLFGKLKK